MLFYSISIRRKAACCGGANEGTKISSICDASTENRAVEKKKQGGGVKANDAEASSKIGSYNHYEFIVEVSMMKSSSARTPDERWKQRKRSGTRGDRSSVSLDFTDVSFTRSLSSNRFVWLSTSGQRS